MGNAERLLEAIHTVLPDVIYVYNFKEGKHSYISRPMVEEYGQSVKDMADGNAESISFIVHPDDLPAIADNFKNIQQLKDGEVLEFKCRTKTSKGEFQWTETRQVVFSRTETGEVKEVLGISRNVHNRHIEQLALKKSQSIGKIANWTYYINTQDLVASDEFFVIKEIENVNNRATLAQVLNIDSEVNFLEGMKPLYEKALNGESIEFKSDYITPSGKIKHTISKVIEITFDDKGAPYSVFGTLQDVTDQVENEKKILRKTELLQNYSFFTSHKLRAPLTNMISLAKAMHEDMPELADNKLFKHCNIELQKLDSIVHELNQIVTTDVKHTLGIDTPLADIQKLMLVDDDEVTNYLQKRELERVFSNAEFAIYTDASKAFDMLEEFAPDLILLDINMPGWNGWDFVEAMTKKGYEYPVVIVTSSIDIADKQKAFDYPLIKNFVTKPITKDLIFKILNVDSDVIKA